LKTHRFIIELLCLAPFCAQILFVESAKAAEERGELPLLSLAGLPSNHLSLALHSSRVGLQDHLWAWDSVCGWMWGPVASNRIPCAFKVQGLLLIDCLCVFLNFARFPVCRSLPLPLRCLQPKLSHVIYIEKS
jgi:hypothetical protein